MHQLRWLASEGVTDVVYSIGYLGHMIRDELAPRDDLGCTCASSTKARNCWVPVAR